MRSWWMQLFVLICVEFPSSEITQELRHGGLRHLGARKPNSHKPRNLDQPADLGLSIKTDLSLQRHNGSLPAGKRLSEPSCCCLGV